MWVLVWQEIANTMRDFKNTKTRQRYLQEVMKRNELITKLKALIPDSRDKGLYIEAQAIAQLVDYIEKNRSDDSSFLMKLLRRNRVQEEIR